MATPALVEWEEVVVSNDKGRRVVNYYLKDAAGARELAVVGREKSVRHMSYDVSRSFLMRREAAAPSSSSSAANSPSRFGGLRLRSRREVIDWLSSLVNDFTFYEDYPMMDRFSDDEDAETADIPASKVLSSGKMGHHSKEISWLGSAWICKKRRKHYRSFSRNSVTISVHDFVYVMADENKRLVAYVEDLYEDLKANNMVMVRWFHKVDEVAIVLPPDINDREIFFSLCLQDFSVECIDGLAAVLNAQDFDKFRSEVRHRYSSWKPYMCRRQIDNDDVKPFDITQVQGYWSQELLRSIYSSDHRGSLKLRLKITCGGSPSSLVNGDGNNIGVPKKKHRLNGWHEYVDDLGIMKANKSRNVGIGNKTDRNVLRKDLLKHKLQQQQKQKLAPGCQVEVLCQDSGIRGCWFKCVVLKRHREKMKVRYQDILDAEESGNLEEWVLSSRISSPDKLCIRLCGRPVVRPHSPRNKGKFPISFDVGSIVDAWWHDGWWEGIVIRKESEENIHVYFPGEERFSIFDSSELRQSQEWVDNKWNLMKARPDIASLLLPEIVDQKAAHHGVAGGYTSHQPSDSSGQIEADISDPPEEKAPSISLSEGDPVSAVKHKEGHQLNLVKACQLNGLKWSTSKKRRRKELLVKEDGSPYKRHCHGSGSSSSSREEAGESDTFGGEFSMTTPLPVVVDQENCKLGGDPLFGSPMALCSSLVMSR